MRFQNTLYVALASITTSAAFSSKHIHPQRHSLSLAAVPPSKCSTDETNKAPQTTTAPTRSQFLQRALLSTVAATTSTISLPSDANAQQQPDATSTSLEKQYNLSPESIAQIVYDDLVQNSFLTNGKLTRSIYDEKATFTDEIDTYTLPQWIKGTAKLFVPPPSSSSLTAGNSNSSKRGGSRVGLVGDVIATDEKIEFNFEEDLMFNIPFNPVVFVSGKVILDRDLDTGLITSYREFWDQDVSTVLKSARFK